MEGILTVGGRKEGGSEEEEKEEEEEEEEVGCDRKAEPSPRGEEKTASYFALGFSQRSG